MITTSPDHASADEKPNMVALGSDPHVDREGHEGRPEGGLGRPPEGWRTALPQDFPKMESEEAVVSFIYGPDHSFLQILIQQHNRTFLYNAGRLEWGLVRED